MDDGGDDVAAGGEVGGFDLVAGLDLLELIARGSTNREAAKRLFISETTVKTHLPHVYAKLGVNDRAAAVAAAFSRGYLAPRD